jgi:enoyl-CoA hydratase
MSVLVEIQDQIATLTINRPEALNAINKAVMVGLDEFFTQYEGNFDIRGVIIKGAGEKAFVAGADIKEFSSFDILQGEQASKYGQDVFFKIERFHAPVIACINGFTLGGGCELAMACHMRVATIISKFGQPEVNLGIVPGYGATQRLVHLIGKGKAMELLMTADMLKADEALSLGLVNHVTEVGAEFAKCLEIINKIKAKAPIAIQHVIQATNDSLDESKNGFDTESKAFGLTITTTDGKEGALAFVEKRAPNFVGK